MSRVVDAATALAQARASDPEASAWVSANAGSGKTYVLALRVIRLLLAGVDPGRILCLTFTKAAAAEMATRVFNRLAEWTALSDVALGEEIAGLDGAWPSPERLAAARRLFAKALETPGGLKVQTIHAFCERLLHQFPFEANVAGHFDVLDERTAATLVDLARRHVIAAAAAHADPALGAALATMLSAANDMAVEAAVTGFVEKRDQLRAWVVRAGSLDRAIAELRATLGLTPDDTVEAIAAELLDGGPWTRAALARLAGQLETGNSFDRESAGRMRVFLAASEGMRVEAYLAIFFKDNGDPRAPARIAGKRFTDADLGTAIVAELARVDRLRDRLRAAATFGASAAMLRLADAVIAEYDSRKRRRGALDFDDLIVRTAALLSRVDAAAWVHYKLDRGLDHVLVDEAQDTSPRQWQVVKALVEEFFAGTGASRATRTLFAVGDEKQSIFSFQGAVPAWFSRMRRRLGGAAVDGGRRWHGLELHLSFRSAPIILEAVDTVFARPEAHRGLTGEPAPTLHTALRRGEAGRVILWPAIKPPDSTAPEDWTAPLDQRSAASPEAQLAERIATTIAGWIVAGERLEATGAPIRAGDILILSRRRGPETAAINRALKRHGIPIAGTDRLTLTTHIAVMDLMALGQVMLLPEDDLALAAVLKSPLIGLDEDALFALARGRRGTLWAALAAAGAPYAAARDRLAAWRALADYLDPHAFYARVLGPDRGRRQIVRRLGHEAEDVLDEFLAQALAFEQANTPSLQGFLAWLGEAPTEIKRDTDMLRDEVRVMTAHGAKGLEAPIVFLVDSGAAPVHASHDPVVVPLGPAEDDGDGNEAPPRPLVWRLNQRSLPRVVANAVETLRERAREEYRRLLYVAMTRARDRLYVCGIEKERISQTERPLRWYDLILAGLAGEAVEIKDADGTLIALEWRPAGAQPPAGVGTVAADADDVVTPAWLDASAPPPPPARRRLSPSTASEAAEAAPPPVRPAAGRAEGGLPPAERGRLIHRLLQSLPDHPPESRSAVAGAYLAAAAPAASDAERAALLAETLGVLAEPRFAPVFAPGSLAEVEIAGLAGEAGVNGRIDRLAVTADCVLIVDYKTNRPVPRALADVPPAYILQLALYRRILAALYPGKAVAAAILWTDGPALMEIPASTLDAALATIVLT